MILCLGIKEWPLWAFMEPFTFLQMKAQLLLKSLGEADIVVRLEGMVLVFVV